MSRYARKVDENQPEIVKLWRSLGAKVIDTSHVGSGFPDVIVCWRGRLLWCELKDGAKVKSARKLTGDQVIFHAEVARYGCPVHLVETREQALALLGAREAA